MDMKMTSNSSKDSSRSATASAHHQHQQEYTGTAWQLVETRNVKQARKQAAANSERKPRPQLDEALKCPRCDSSNTKFCYYNNYSMLQPRYFCKACRRFWTQGGSLRDIPVGGGSRKNKRGSTLLPSSSGSSPSLQQHMVPASSTADFPNVLPMFTPTGINFPSSHQMPPFTPVSLSTLAPVSQLDFDAGTMTSSFMHMLKGGRFLGGYQEGNNNGFFRPSSGMEMPTSFGFGATMQQQSVVGDHGGGGTALIGNGCVTQEGRGQWPIQVSNNQQEQGATVPYNDTPK